MANDNQPAQLPSDATTDERRYFELTGSTEMYDLRKRNDEAQRARIKANQDEADRIRLEAHMRALRQQAEDAERSAQYAATQRQSGLVRHQEDPWNQPRSVLVGSENLPEAVKQCITRIFMTIPEWTPENQQGLVNLLNAMGSSKSLAWAHEMLQGLAADSYGSLELTPDALLRGCTGLKKIAGPQLMGDVQAISGSNGSSKPRGLGGSKKGRGKRRDRDGSKGDRKVVQGIIEPRTPSENSSRRVQDDSHEEQDSYKYEYVDDGESSYDESPMGSEGLDSV